MNKPNSKMDDINILINQGQYTEVTNLFLSAISELKINNSPLLSEYYYEFAMFLFNNNEYEMSLLMSQAAYNLNYKKDEIISFIYDSFVLPNSEEFKETYKKNITSYSGSILTSLIPSFEELHIDFIPYDEDKYFIYNKKDKIFEGMIDISKESLEDFKTIDFDDELSDVVVSGSWNIVKLKDVILSNNNRILYYLESDIKKSLSFLKIPNIMEFYCHNIKFIDTPENLQSYLHKNTSIYLPRLYYGSSLNCKKMNITKIIEEEHQYRLTPEGRNKSNIIFTIAIPSYNRGHRALQSIQNLLKSQYDAEIEFVVSNNGSIKNTEGYDEIERIPDSRINYFKYEENQGPHVNFCQVINISHGKYTCLLSDEDLINIPSLTHYLYILKSNLNISFATSRSWLYYKHSTSKFCKQGSEAFLYSLLNSNYISGLIYRTDLFHDLNIFSWTLDNMTNNKGVDYYAHSCWVMFFVLYGDYYEDNVVLIKEGNSEPMKTVNVSGNNVTKPMLPFSTLESRIEQHNGFIDVLNQLEKAINKETYIQAYIILCNKNFFLLSLVKNKYADIGISWEFICLKIAECCNDGLNRININITADEKDSIISRINELYLIYSDNK